MDTQDSVLGVERSRATTRGLNCRRIANYFLRTLFCTKRANGTRDRCRITSRLETLPFGALASSTNPTMDGERSSRELVPTEHFTVDGCLAREEARLHRCIAEKAINTLLGASLEANTLHRC